MKDGTATSQTTSAIAENPERDWIPEGQNFAEKIKSLRLFLTCSQLEFATILGLKSFQAVSEWERGVRTPEFNDTAKGAAAYSKRLVKELKKRKGLSEQAALVAVNSVFNTLRKRIEKNDKATSEENAELRLKLEQAERTIEAYEQLLLKANELVDWQSKEIEELKAAGPSDIDRAVARMQPRMRELQNQYLAAVDWDVIAEACLEVNYPVTRLLSKERFLELRDGLTGESHLMKLARQATEYVSLLDVSDVQTIQDYLESAVAKVEEAKAMANVARFSKS